MSAWDDFVGLFTGDTYFPDNPERESRVNELSYDCSNFSTQLAVLDSKVKTNFENINKELQTIYSALPTGSVDISKVNIQYESWGVEVAEIIAPLVTGAAVGAALNVAATSALLASGQIGAAAFASLVGLPIAFSVAITGVAAVAAIGITFAVGAIAGAVKRDKLQDAIHEGVAARIKLQKAVLINSKLNSSLESIIGAIKVFKENNIATPNILNYLKSMVEKSKQEIDSINDDSAKNVLSALDRSRGSWTNED